MIHFPALGDSYTDPEVPDSLFTLVGVRRFPPKRNGRFEEEWELELLCVVAGQPTRWRGNDIYVGKRCYAVGTLALLTRMYTCLNV